MRAPVADSFGQGSGTVQKPVRVVHRPLADTAQSDRKTNKWEGERCCNSTYDKAKQ